ncbi:hypothetical protein AAG570_005534 [Ranatra chinensis]|uniref:Uncharacterized protein n=1 Tax=Ranatra chinensis TaxID=642074 RepID=A0ABD0YJG9_9HEMI
MFYQNNKQETAEIGAPTTSLQAGTPGRPPVSLRRPAVLGIALGPPLTMAPAPLLTMALAVLALAAPSCCMPQAPPDIAIEDWEKCECVKFYLCDINQRIKIYAEGVLDPNSLIPPAGCVRYLGLYNDKRDPNKRLERFELNRKFGLLRNLLHRTSKLSLGNKVT